MQAKIAAWEFVLAVPDAEITARGATCSAPADRPYGMREFVVTTIDGHRIVFGQELRHASA